MRRGGSLERLGEAVKAWRDITISSDAVVTSVWVTKSIRSMYTSFGTMVIYTSEKLSSFCPFFADCRTVRAYICREWGRCSRWNVQVTGRLVVCTLKAF